MRFTWLDPTTAPVRDQKQLNPMKSLMRWFCGWYLAVLVPSMR